MALGSQEAIQQSLQQCSEPDGAREQSQRIAVHEREPHWSEGVPDWCDWNA